MFRKNTASQHVYFQLLSTTDGSAVTGASVSVRRCLDGTFAAATGTVTEDTAGWYKFAMSQADTNGNNVGLRFSATGAITVSLTFVTTDLNPYDAVRAGLTALPNAAAEASGGLPTLSAAQASNGTINANVHRWLTGTPNALSSGRVEVLVGAVTDGVLTSAKFAAGAFDAVWSVATRILTAGTNIVLAKGTGITGFNDLSAAQVNAEVDTAISDAGLVAAVADLPTNAELATALGTADDAVLAAIAALNNPSANQIRDAIFSRAYSAAYGSFTFSELTSILLAVAVGKLSGAETTEVTIRNPADDANVVVATVDSDGNRSAVTVTP